MMRSNPLFFLGAQTIERPLKPILISYLLRAQTLPGRRQLWNLIVADYVA